MGCHTWFYYPIERTQEEARRLALIELDRTLKQNEMYILEGFKLRNGKIKKPTSQEELDIYISLGKYYKRWIRRLESNHPLWKSAAWLFNPKEESCSMYVNGKYYLQLSDYNDCFRVPSDLSGEKLFSLESTVKFFDAHKERIQCYRDIWLEEVTEFFRLHPNGFIAFG